MKTSLLAPSGLPGVSAGSSKRGLRAGCAPFFERPNHRRSVEIMAYGYPLRELCKRVAPWAGATGVRKLDAPLWREGIVLAPWRPRVIFEDCPATFCRPIHQACHWGPEVLRLRQPVLQRIAWWTRRLDGGGPRIVVGMGRKRPSRVSRGTAARVLRHFWQGRPRGPGFGIEVAGARLVTPGIPGPEPGREARTLSALPSYNPTSSACTPEAVTVSRTCWLLTLPESNSTTMRCGRSS